MSQTTIFHTAPCHFALILLLCSISAEAAPLSGSKIAESLHMAVTVSDLDVSAADCMRAAIADASSRLQQLTTANIS